MSKLYASVTGITNPISIVMNENHGASTSTLIVECLTHTLNIGDTITADIGYTDNHSVLFTGYVKQLERKIPSNIYTITANDIMIRAIDYFIVSTNPEEPYRFENESAETVVAALMSMAGLNNFSYDPTYFTLAIGMTAEVNLVSSYDYSSNIADLLAWHLYADGDTIKFVNRKPYVMVGDVAASSLTTGDFLSFAVKVSEKELRNRVVVYGSTGVYADAESATSYNPLTSAYEQILPTDYYKTALAASYLINSDSLAQDAADYNLELCNRLGVSISATIIGDPTIRARTVVDVTESITGTTGSYYVYMAEHSWDKSGYIVNLDLRK